MKIQINQLGPIQKSSTVDLNKKFMVFVGDNGSGKTYVANLLFGIFKAVWMLIDKQHSKENSLKADFNQKDKIALGVEEIPRKLALNSRMVKLWFNGLPESLLDKVDINFILDYKQDFLQRGINIDVNSEGNWISYVKEKGENIILRKGKRKDKGFENLTEEEKKIAKNSDWLEAILNDFIKPEKAHNTTFFPANRGSLLSTFKYILRKEREEKDEIFRINKEGRNLNEAEIKYYQTSYSLPYKVLVNKLENFDTQPLIIQHQYQDLLQELEEIMGGSIKVSETLEGFGRRRYTYTLKDSEEELELFMASSSVNQLSTLYLYLKYWVQESHNTIIIDEPEINLHPDNQVKLVNLLMKFADRDNNKVIMTTHSPLLADAVNNHIRIGYLQAKGGEQQKAWLKENEEYLKKHAFDLNENLTYKDFVVYHFEQGGIEEYPITDYGVVFDSFRETNNNVIEVEEELNEQIYDSIYKQ